MKLIKTCSLVLALGVMAASVAQANDTSSGCGVGWQVTNKQSLLGTTTRDTTNYFLPNTFSMTSGTSGCAQHSFAKKDEPAVRFVVSNYEPLIIQMSEGRGEYVDGLARTMGCGSDLTDAFGAMTQSKYREISGAAKVSPFDVFEKVKAEVQADPVLAIGCRV